MCTEYLSLTATRHILWKLLRFVKKEWGTRPKFASFPPQGCFAEYRFADPCHPDSGHTAHYPNNPQAFPHLLRADTPNAGLDQSLLEHAFQGENVLQQSLYEASEAGVALDVRNFVFTHLKGARPDHLARLQALADQGKLLAAGPHPALDTEDPGEAGFTGSLVIAEFNSLEAATSWADADPYVNAGVFKNVTVKPYKLVLP